MHLRPTEARVLANMVTLRIEDRQRGRRFVSAVGPPTGILPAGTSPIQ